MMGSSALPEEKKLIILLWGFVIEGTGIEVARKQAVDVETEHGKNLGLK